LTWRTRQGQARANSVRAEGFDHGFDKEDPDGRQEDQDERSRQSLRKAAGGPKRTPQYIADISVIAGGRDVI
jgi:hypothetical protein